MVKLVGSTLDHAFMMRPHVIAHPISTMKVRGDISVIDSRLPSWRRNAGEIG